MSFRFVKTKPKIDDFYPKNDIKLHVLYTELVINTHVLRGIFMVHNGASVKTIKNLNLTILTIMGCHSDLSKPSPKSMILP